MIRARVETEQARAALERLKLALTPEQIDPVVDLVAHQALAKLVEATPKKWFGQVRRGWHVEKPAEGKREIINRNKVMLFLEEGTANDGSGYIYPTKSKFLFIPLDRRAAGGWFEGLKLGVDYVLAARVRGIKARHIVKNLAPGIREEMKNALKVFIRKALGHG